MIVTSFFVIYFHLLFTDFTQGILHMIIAPYLQTETLLTGEM